MDNEHQDIQGAIQALTAEMRQLRRTVVIGFSVVCFIIGLTVFSYGNYVVMTACFVAAAMFLLWEPVARGPMGKAITKIGKQIGEEVRRQHSPRPTITTGHDDIRPA